MEYDDVVVGAGSAGAALAARLSEDPDRSVLLLEAGADYQAVEQTPDDLLRTWISAGPHDWGFVAKATADREIAYPRGKVTGGCSAVNGHIALRGTPEDFDEWAAWGNREWSFDKILPYYRKLENDRDAEGDFHGASGPIWIERPRRETWQPINKAFYDACREIGYAEAWDHNEPRATGVGPWPRNRRDGVRISTAIGYLHPARHRLNLTIRSFCNVHRVIVEGGRAVGVAVECGGAAQTVRARRVTLSAGAINSPAILMRSGIGPRAELEALGVRCVVDSPGVGANLIDHVLAPVVAIPAPGVPHDPQVTNPVGIRYTASGSNEFNDMQMYALNFFDKSLWIGSELDLPVPSIALAPGLQRPRARGRVSLRSADPNVPAAIDLNYLGDAEDLRRMADGVRLAWRIMNSKRFAPYLKEFVNINAETVASDAAVADFVRANCGTIYHPVGTAKMGPESDPMAVVDQYCRVRGVEGLRVADASVMPNIVRANTNLTCIMIGERVADWMRAQA
ncbi:GMC family oxidoreductase N-terminal domain-containing protein [bacterium]|nr:GMC family oxidoreductase N-terminal domain-containing protein [bacterium]